MSRAAPENGQPSIISKEIIKKWKIKSLYQPLPASEKERTSAMVARKQLINPRYGQALHSLREERNLSLDYFKEIVPKTSLERFEKGESVLPPEKLEAVLAKMKLSIFTFLFLADNIPVYRRYGETFQLLREQRGYDLESFENVNLSTWTLEKFEAGKVMLDFAQVDSALQMMHLPLYEYTHLLDKGEDDYFSEVYKTVDNAFFADDVATLKKLYEESIPYDDFRMLALAIKACYDELDLDEIEEVSDFLFGVEVWTNLELFVFNYTVSQLRYKLVRSIWKDLFRSLSFFEDNRDYRIRVVRAATATCLAMIDKDNIYAAAQFLEYTRGLLQTTDEFTRCMFKFTESLIFYLQKKSDSALSDMQEVIHIFDFLGDEVLAKKFQNILEKYC